jgi:diguanylate cyclase (GGDEF)-like protein/PAS domain S-box-containing protein
LPHGGEVATRIGIEGFTMPNDYVKVRSLLQTLRLPPYESAPDFTVSDVVQRYGIPIGWAMAIGVVILMLIFWLVLLNHRLGRQRLRLMRQSQERQRLLAALGDGVFGLDQQSRCSFINPAALKLLGYSSDEVIGINLHTLVHRVCDDGSHCRGHECPVLNTLQDGKTRHLEEWFLRKDGTGLPVMLTVTPVVSGSQQEGVVVVFSDISERLHLEQELRTQATTDALTGLPNRRQFLIELDSELNRIKRHPDLPASILMVDLDHFKRINDRFGHATGDTVLKHFAQELIKISRKSDKLGRLGGEEFSVLLPNTSLEQACMMANRLCESVAVSEVFIERETLHYTVSIGVATLTSADKTMDSALQRSDEALYRAKNAGRNRVACEAGNG